MKLLPIPLSPLNAPPPLGLWNSELLWRYPPAPPSPLADLKTQLPPQLNTDPRIWGRDEVVVFLRFCEREFDLPKFDLDLFQMNGKALCVLTKNDLAERSPGAGDVLHNVLQMLIRDAQTLHRHLPSSPVTPTGRYPLSPHSHPPTPNWSALAPPDSPFFHSSHLQQFMAASNSVTLSPAPSIDSQAGSPPSQSHGEQNVFQQQQQQQQQQHHHQQQPPKSSSGAGSSSSSSTSSSTNGSGGNGSSANGGAAGPATNGTNGLISSSSSSTTSSVASSTSSSVSNQSDSDEEHATVGNGTAATSTTGPGSSNGNGYHPLPLSHPDSKLPLIATHPPQQSPPLTPISKETQHLGQLQLLDTKTLQYPVSSLLNGSSGNGGSNGGSSREREPSSSSAAATAAAVAAAVLGLKGAASNGGGSSGSSGSGSAPSTPGAFLPVKREFFPDSPEPNTISSGSLSDGRLLWDFLQQLLNDPSQRYSSYIAWKCRDTGVFKIVDPAGLAKLWGKQKNHLSMNYDKMSRALRYYYRVNILRKVQGERHCYQFLRNPTELKSIKNISLLRQTMAASQAAAAAAAAQSNGNGGGGASERNGDRGASSVVGNGSASNGGSSNNPLMSLLPNGANIHHLAAAAAAAAASQNGPLSPSSSSPSSSPSALHHHHHHLQQQHQAAAAAAAAAAAIHSHHLAVQNGAAGGAGGGPHQRNIKMETDLDDLKPTDLSTNDRKFSYGSPVNGTDCYPLIRNANGLTTIQLLRQQQQQQQSEAGSPPSSPTPLSINSQSLHTISSNLHHLHQQQLQAQAAAAAAIAAAAEARHQQDAAEQQQDHPLHHQSSSSSSHHQHQHHHPARNGSRSSSTSGASDHDHREPHDRDRDTPSPANSESSAHQQQSQQHHHSMHVKSDDDSMMPTDLSKSEPMYYK
ncbi:ets DNA-binding protein pokkuri isoform X1 [Anopheles gambiae]|uniref:ets DNA-binding protein pokkuri isoform X1 n=1 Tax=Anopheles gambiae TaxID=7165 RepID=UPI002AC9BB41|nr:ets DNA-binding protein pokkuri isoform X1 [Anopheles gambiae]XP_061510609.1 ets DNA-binding protein pokkuri isoform X1 [Anopheles gambiae]XP_061510610.1 ets DNA-binding protein pokkuri isoform X1 [Anopheles gambiae]XP_061510611.1 ets DNA-binding protein pokkuri isoform X1 [Anopheles gambiae]XP_061510612.1 ets DNA-binding protein pokkuri isoform X1 [Anopheles gambiae]XP_061510613.1 ets DNA-binding protein pokkuri isoform X1 [Anopheles gambiae]